MHVTVGAVPLDSLGHASCSEPSRDVRARVVGARATQRVRYCGLRGVTCNAHVGGRWLDSRTGVDQTARSTLVSAATTLALSARGYHRALKVARTIADLDGDTCITEASITEALRYRASSGYRESTAVLE
jgi:magnesium chelatase family protein